jgi:hypothetical protein
LRRLDVAFLPARVKRQCELPVSVASALVEHSDQAMALDSPVIPAVERDLDAVKEYDCVGIRQTRRGSANQAVDFVAISRSLSLKHKDTKSTKE